MATVTATRPPRKARRKPARTVTVLERPTATADGRLLVTEGPPQ